MGTLIQLDIMYLEDLLRCIKENKVSDVKIEQLEGIIRYGRLTECRLLKRCEICPKNKPKNKKLDIKMQ